MEIDALSRDILQAMSENCRRSLSSLAKELHTSPKTLKKKLAKLEEEYGIKYTLELDESALGLNATYFVKINFSNPPSEKKLRRVLKKYPEIQFAALTKGDFDLLIYAVARTPLDFARWSNSFRQSMWQNLESWEAGVTTGFWFGFFILGEEVTEHMKLKHVERVILRELIRNARIPLSELARKADVPLSTAQYHLKKILSSKAVKRATLVMTRPPLMVHYIGLYEYKMTEDFLRRDTGVREVLTSEVGYEPMNQLMLAFNVAGAAFDDVLFYSLNSLDEAYEYQKELRNRFGDELKSNPSAFVLNVLKGNLPCRKLAVKDNYNSKLVNIYDKLSKD